MQKLYYDLHIHSCLSPCADDDMTPANIVGMAYIKGLDVIAVTDHNSCKNVRAVWNIAKERGILCIPGMELTTSEEVHVLCYFPTVRQALLFDQFVYEQIEKINNQETIFGNQFICNELDQIIGKERKLLLGRSRISFFDLKELVGDYGGIVIPAHIEKPSNSVLSQLGFISETTLFHSVEIKEMTHVEQLCHCYKKIKDCYVVCNSDAHSLEWIQEAVHFITVRERNIENILNILNGTYNYKV